MATPDGNSPMATPDGEMAASAFGNIQPSKRKIAMNEKTEDETEFDGQALDRITERLIDAMRQLSSLRVLLIEAHAEAGKARHERWLERKARP